MFSQRSGYTLCHFLTMMSIFTGIITSPTTSSNADSHQTTPGSAASNVSTIALQKYAIYPIEPKAVAEIGQLIKTHIKVGSVQMIPSQNRPQYNGVLL